MFFKWYAALDLIQRIQKLLKFMYWQIIFTNEVELEDRILIIFLKEGFELIYTQDIDITF